MALAGQRREMFHVTKAISIKIDKVKLNSVFFRLRKIGTIEFKK
jgi:hypothetical protein